MPISDAELEEFQEIMEMFERGEGKGVTKQEIEDLMKSIGVDVSDAEIDAIVQEEELNEFREIIQELKKDGETVTDSDISEVMERLGVQISQEEIDSVIREIESMSRCPDTFDNLALIRATEKGDYHLLKCLLSKDPSNIDFKDHDGNTPLIWASFTGHVNTIELLLDHGASINVQDNIGLTALMYSVTQRHDHSVNLLLSRGSNVFIKDKDGNTALHWAARSNSESITSVLIGKCADPKQSNNEGLTPLNEAEKHEHRNVITSLRNTLRPSHCPRAASSSEDEDEDEEF